MEEIYSAKKVNEQINDHLFIDTLSDRNRLVKWAKVLRNV